MNFHYFPGCRAPWVINILQVKIVVIDSELVCYFVHLSDKKHSIYWIFATELLYSHY